MQKKIGKRGKLEGEAAFFNMFVEVALSPNMDVAKDLAMRNTSVAPPSPAAGGAAVAGLAPTGNEEGGPQNVQNSSFTFTAEAKLRKLNSPSPCQLWEQKWKKRVETQPGQAVMLPGQAYAFENLSQVVADRCPSLCPKHGLSRYTSSAASHASFPPCFLSH